jgi:uncharacterized protein
MVTRVTGIKRLVLVRLSPGEDVLAALTEAVKKEGVRNGVILNGLGSVRSYRYHVVADDRLPPLEAVAAARQPRDVVAYSGAILDGRVHAHITLSDASRAEGGHLEPGTEVLTFSVVIIADLGDTVLDDWDSIGAL